MVAIMASLNNFSPSDRSNADRNVCYISDGSSNNLKLNKLYFENSDGLNIIRSVTMSANVAFAVVDEVKHFIHVNSFETESLLESKISSVASSSDISFELTKEFVQLKINRQEHEHDYFHSLMSSCSFVLPSEGDDIVSAVVISKWDDVIGPQTVHAWLKNNLKYDESTFKSEVAFRHSVGSYTFPVSERAYSNVCSCGFSDPPSGSDGRRSELLNDMYFCKERLRVLKAIKYITSHTVNYSNESVLVDETNERNMSVFIVPEIDLIAQCIVFQLKDKDRRVLYSIALLANYFYYNSCLQLSRYCQHWLQESSFRIEEIFMQCAESNKNFKVTEEVNSWVLELCSGMTSLGSLKMSALHPSCYSGVLYSHFLPYALTSHLQTFCCSIVSGSSIHYMNMLIAFLALFLENSERACSCFANSTQEFLFHHGLFLQGMLTNSSELRECNSLRFGKHIDPVTSINIVSDVKLDPIRQPQFHWLYVAHLQNNLHEVFIVRNSFEPVKRSASLVNSFLSDINKLPSTHWKSIIYMFKKKLNIFGHMLLTLVSTLRESGCRSKLVFQGDLCERMGICGADFLIILAVAEKLKPGTYNYIIECEQTYT